MSIILLQQTFLIFTGASSDLAIISSTLGIAALFNPLRGHIQRGIDRRFFRRRYDARLVITEFADTVRNETDLQKLSERLLQVIDDTMQPTHVHLWLSHPSTLKEKDKNAE
ncbi:MAG: hypothetical protein HZB51_01335 [Chloroflexi bacterium]|nr:hypothetical protein [Chloroflexota bacterium]